MNAYPLVLLLGLAAGRNEQLLDGFQYPDSAAAARAWVAADTTPPVTLVQDGDRTVLELKTPFASQPSLPRSVIDRDVKLNLAVPGEFALEVYVPESTGHLSLYFRSGNGWYAGGADPWRKGWQTLSFSKADFRMEGKPAGWHQIDGIRIALWRGAPKDSFIRLRRLAALAHDVALVIPAPGRGTGDREVQDRPPHRRRRGRALERNRPGGRRRGRHGPGPRRPGKTPRGDPRLQPAPGRSGRRGLGGFREAGRKARGVLPVAAAPGKGPRLRQAEIRDAKTPGRVRRNPLRRRRHPGPARLGPAGLLEHHRRRADRPGGPRDRPLARLSGQTDGPPGHARQPQRGVLLATSSSWTTARARSRCWPRCWAIWTHRCGSPWSKASWPGSAGIGHLENLEDLSRYVARSQAGGGQGASGDRAGHAPGRQAALGKRRLRRRGRAGPRGPAAPGGGVSAGHARAGRRKAGPSGTTPAPGPIPAIGSARPRSLAAGGFNMVLPNMLWGGVAHYASDVLPRSATFEKLRRPDRAVRRRGPQARHRGPRVEGQLQPLRAPRRSFVQKMRKAGRTQVSVPRPAGRLALPVAPGELQAGAGEPVGGRAQVRRGRAALRLHPLSRRRHLLLRRLPPAVRRARAARRSPTGPRTATRGPAARSITRGVAGRSPAWSRPSAARARSSSRN